ncbi:MAG TPA: YciI family protein [Candidatus Obscuribacter sp.]|nr:YciI family protein [Candidatus Obscuribacter sp.]
MQFVLIGRDGDDAEALSRRMAAREAHLAGCANLRENGVLLYAAAILSDDTVQKMIGSMLVLDFASRADLDAWLKEEPYVKGDVWKKIEINPCKLAPGFAGLAPSSTREHVVH